MTNPCPTPHCPNPNPCPQHPPTPHRTNPQLYRTARWQRLRRAILHYTPNCPCGNPATDIDHITPLENEGPPYDRANLQALCHSCHSAKTNRELRQRTW